MSFILIFRRQAHVVSNVSHLKRRQEQCEPQSFAWLNACHLSAFLRAAMHTAIVILGCRFFVCLCISFISPFSSFPYSQLLSPSAPSRLIALVPLSVSQFAHATPSEPRGAPAARAPANGALSFDALPQRFRYKPLSEQEIAVIQVSRPRRGRLL